MASVKHFRAKCTGCNYCVELAPAFWDMNDTDGKSDLVGAIEKKGVFFLEIQDYELDLIQECVELCPAKAIKIEGK